MECCLPPASKNSGVGTLSVVEEYCAQLSVVSNRHFITSSEKAAKCTTQNAARMLLVPDPSALGA